MPTAKRVHESARTKEPLPVLRFSSVPPLFTELAAYSVCTLAAGGEHFRNSPTVWTERFKAMLGAILLCLGSAEFYSSYTTHWTYRRFFDEAFCLTSASGLTVPPKIF